MGTTFPALVNNSLKQYRTKRQLYSHLPFFSQNIQLRWTKHAGYCGVSKEELINEVILQTLMHGRASVNQSART